MLSFEPETLEVMQQRYQAALVVLYGHELTTFGKQDRPCQDGGRTNVFDFEDGIRLVVSRDLFADGVEAVHFSVSVRHGTEMDYRAQDGRLDRKKLKKIGMGRFMALSQIRLTDGAWLEFVGQVGSVFHWRLRCPDANQCATAASGSIPSPSTE